MNLKYNVIGAARKALAKAIGEILAADVVYNGTPSFSYTVADFTIDRDGNVSTAHENRERIGRLIAALKQRGYEAETDEIPDYSKQMTEREELGVGQEHRNHEGENAMQESDVTESETPDCLAIEIPLDGFTDNSISNLEKLISSKARLIKKALGIEVLTFEKIEHRLRFPWFKPGLEPEDFTAYAWFITAMCDMAKRLKRVTAKEKESNNDKFDMRIFLIRLGFIGPEYKSARKILLRNLSGNSSYAKKSGTEEP